MPFYIRIEAIAVILHCVYAFVSFGIQNNPNTNFEIAVPLMQVMFWAFAILYLVSLIASAFQESVFSIILCIIIAAVGAALCYAIITLGLIAAILCSILLAIIIIFLFM